MRPHLMFEEEAVGESHFQLVAAASVRVIEQAFSTQQPASLHFQHGRRVNRRLNEEAVQTATSVLDTRLVVGVTVDGFHTV